MLSKNMAVVYAELNRRQYAMSIETLSRICGMNHTLIGQCITGLVRRGLVRAVRREGLPTVYKSRQLSLFGSAA